ncbi:MAG TPA: SusC/RagA family TonB-linked outer membrane protein [Longimicrobiales bacterium]
MRRLQWFVTFVAAVAVLPATLAAQEAARITGKVTTETGGPAASAVVSITALGVSTVAGADGNYLLLVPAARIPAARQVELTVQRIGLRSQTVTVTLEPGASLTRNFTLALDVLELERIVATGQGTATTRERLSTSISTVDAEAITRSREPNVVAALAGKAANVQVVSSSGDPGAGAYIRIRDAASIVGGTQPLFVVDGTPVDNASNATMGTTGGTAVTNRASDINPNDIESIEILKGAAATAIYGSRGANGVVLIKTRSGRPGDTRVSFRSSVSVDEVNRVVPLQRRYGRGLSYLAYIPMYTDIADLNADFGTDFASFDEARAAFSDPSAEDGSTVSWGAPLAEDVETFDHASELYDPAVSFENNLTLSGGTDRTTYYLGVGRVDRRGTVEGNQGYVRNSVRLKGTHVINEDLRVSGNIAYSDSRGEFIQQGSNTSGILLGALRTPPEFDNRVYLDPETGLQRSYRVPNPTSPNQSSGYDNPFFTANMGENTSEVGRTFGNVSLRYTPRPWLSLDYTLGADYSSDEVTNFLPKSSATAPTGQLIQTSFVTRIFDSNLSATASGSLSDGILGRLTVGQNLNHREFHQSQVSVQNLLAGTKLTDFSVDRTPDEFRSTTRTDGYFATGEATFRDQLTVTATGRLDGSSTFGGDGKRFFYPSAGFSWIFSRLGAFEDATWLDFAKLRGSWGRAGRQPPVFSNTTGYSVGFLPGDGFVSNGLNSIYDGEQGVVRQLTGGNPDIRPEVKEEFEVGLDVAFLDQRVSLGVTYYDNTTTDVILAVPVAFSTGYTSQFRNAASFEGNGWEVSLGATPVRRDDFTWTINAQFARSRTCVTGLAGAENIALNGFTGSTYALVSPEVTGECQPFGVFLGTDFVRFGRGTMVAKLNPDGSQVTDAEGNPVMVNIDEAYPGQPDGALYIAENGFPLLDGQDRVVGDPNPDWTASISSSFTLFGNLTISGLIDIKHGGQVWNGTKGALYFFGTHEETLPFQGEGKKATFGDDYMPDTNDFFTDAVGGPGAGKEVPLNWLTWAGPGGIGNGFNGTMSMFIEDGGFVKLRDVSVSYTLDQDWLGRLGLSSVDLTLSGRNLYTWTDYTGIDPESNLTAQSTARGLDYFNNPQTRSFVFTVNMNR